MHGKLPERLSRISKEERHILDGHGVDMKVHSDRHRDAVDAEKLLGSQSGMILP